MAIIYDAQLRPSKSELLAAWLPQQPWFDGDAAAMVRLGAYRFDDPAGEVGIETHVVAVGGATYQVPLTYRGAPLAGAEAFLITTMEHSVLGPRWVYDATADPVYVGELAAALLTGKPQAVEMIAVGDGVEILPVTVLLSCNKMLDVDLPELRCGVPSAAAGVTTIPCGSVTVEIFHVLDTAGADRLDHALTARWDGQAAPVRLASATLDQSDSSMV